MAEHIDVFISSTSRDLNKYRDAVIKVVLKLGLHPIVMEAFNPSDKNAVQLCYEKVQEAEIFVGIYAHRYGYTPPKDVQLILRDGTVIMCDGETSITHYEYLWAVELNLPMLLFIVSDVDDDDHPLSWPVSFIEAEPAKTNLFKFKQMIMQNYVVGFFYSPDHLAIQVATGLIEIVRNQPFLSTQDIIPDLSSFAVVQDDQITNKASDGVCFVSYSHEDSHYAEDVIDLLLAHGIQVWIDNTGLKAGTINWEESIRQAIINAQVLILLASESSRVSRWVLAEIEIAEAYNCPIIPIWVQGERWVDCAPLGLIKSQYIDARQAIERFIINEIRDVISVSAEKRITKSLFSSTAITSSKPANKIFIASAHNDPQAQMVADLLEQELRDYQVTVDMLAIPLGSTATKRIFRKIEQCDFFVPLISSTSSQNEILLAQFEHAIIQDMQIIPIQVEAQINIPYTIRVLLNKTGMLGYPNDERQLFLDLLASLKGKALPDLTEPVFDEVSQNLTPPLASADPEQMVKEDKIYVTRKADKDALFALDVQDAGLLSIRAPLQMGKTAFVIQLTREFIKRGNLVVYIDFRTIDRHVLGQENTFCLWFAQQIYQSVGVKTEAPENVWQGNLGGVLMLTSYLEKYILPQVDENEQMLLLVLDELDILFSASFRSSFFGMIRNWFNRRAYDDLWYLLIQTLVISTDPMLFIENLNMSPFNVGVEVELSDFTFEETNELLNQYHLNLSDKILESMYNYLSGHPYLTHYMAYLLATGEDLDTIIDQELTQEHFFYDHLMRYALILSSDRNLSQAMLNVINEREIPLDVRRRLYSVGLVNALGQVRCNLYKHFFSRRLRYD